MHRAMYNVVRYNCMQLLYPNSVCLPRTICSHSLSTSSALIPAPFPSSVPVPLMLSCYVDNSVLPRRTILRSLKSISCDSID